MLYILSDANHSDRRPNLQAGEWAEKGNRKWGKVTTMPITIEKEWAAVDDDEEIEVTAETKQAVIDALRDEGKDEADYQIVAVPKSHSSMFV